MPKSAFKLLAAILYTIRPSAALGATLLTIAAFQPMASEWKNAGILALCAFSGSAFCFLTNDLYDREKDLLNHKQRPIATGDLPVSIAYLVAGILGVTFIVLASTFGRVVFLLSLLFIVLAASYSYVNRKTGLVANVLVALFVAGTQWGVYLVKPDTALFYTSGYLFFFLIPRELLLDWLDREGDEAYGKVSLAWSTSPKNFSRFVFLMLLLASFTLVLLMFLQSNTFLSEAGFTLTIVFSWFPFVRFFREPSRKHALHGVRLSHLTFAFFIVAMLLR